MSEPTIEVYKSLLGGWTCRCNACGWYGPRLGSMSEAYSIAQAHCLEDAAAL